ncbi:hypothetical protein DACRYDRAFT_99876 [Dacryopinax primogenitus]|uniref:Uncharacterized protein n=1 Tax=Dacryopinax primogenitus (strain DJM 731) TaxID=1858805 RepID=M5G1N4_DACPD|nr:uncharacterized protein DACRYDRAFT_99876 [Dacryopinax primogenitus]EJU02125.1 hypothetical protein DACRYDRAFT_99876 [Dacryopinax primogenitus]
MADNHPPTLSDSIDKCFTEFLRIQRTTDFCPELALELDKLPRKHWTTLGLPEGAGDTIVKGHPILQNDGSIFVWAVLEKNIQQAAVSWTDALRILYAQLAIANLSQLGDMPDLSVQPLPQKGKVVRKISSMTSAWQLVIETGKSMRLGPWSAPLQLRFVQDAQWSKMACALFDIPFYHSILNQQWTPPVFRNYALGWIPDILFSLPPQHQPRIDPVRWWKGDIIGASVRAQCQALLDSTYGALILQRKWYRPTWYSDASLTDSVELYLYYVTDPVTSYLLHCQMAGITPKSPFTDEIVGLLNDLNELLVKHPGLFIPIPLNLLPLDVVPLSTASRCPMVNGLGRLPPGAQVALQRWNDQLCKSVKPQDFDSNANSRRMWMLTVFGRVHDLRTAYQLLQSLPGERRNDRYTIDPSTIPGRIRQSCSTQYGYQVQQLEEDFRLHIRKMRATVVVAWDKSANAETIQRLIAEQERGQRSIARLGAQSAPMTINEANTASNEPAQVSHDLHSNNHAASIVDEVPLVLALPPPSSTQRDLRRTSQSNLQVSTEEKETNVAQQAPSTVSDPRNTKSLCTVDGADIDITLSEDRRLPTATTLRPSKPRAQRDSVRPHNHPLGTSSKSLMPASDLEDNTRPAKRPRREQTPSSRAPAHSEGSRHGGQVSSTINAPKGRHPGPAQAHCIERYRELMKWYHRVPTYEIPISISLRTVFLKQKVKKHDGRPTLAARRPSDPVFYRHSEVTAQLIRQHGWIVTRWEGEASVVFSHGIYRCQACQATAVQELKLEDEEPSPDTNLFDPAACEAHPALVVKRNPMPQPGTSGSV